MFLGMSRAWCWRAAVVSRIEAVSRKQRARGSSLARMVDCWVCGAPNGAHREGCFNCGSLLAAEEGAAGADLERLTVGEMTSAGAWSTFVSDQGLAPTRWRGRDGDRPSLLFLTSIDSALSRSLSGSYGSRTADGPKLGRWPLWRERGRC